MAESGEFIHATCVSIGGNGVLIRGPSGAGKSDLALRLLYSVLPTRFGKVELVGDDQIRIATCNGALIASTAPNTENRIEVRGIGIVHRATIPSTPVRLVADAADATEIVRMPEFAARTTQLLDISIPRLQLSFIEPSAVARLLVALEEANA